MSSWTKNYEAPKKRPGAKETFAKYEYYVLVFVGRPKQMKIIVSPLFLNSKTRYLHIVKGKVNSFSGQSFDQNFLIIPQSSTFAEMKILPALIFQ